MIVNPLERLQNVDQALEVLAGIVLEKVGNNNIFETLREPHKANSRQFENKHSKTKYLVIGAISLVLIWGFSPWDVSKSKYANMPLDLRKALESID